jgi:uncharacterized membrane protein
MSLFMSIYSVFVMETSESIENIISASIVVFSVLLLVLSVSGYRKTRIRLTIYAIIIFALFAIQQFLDLLDDIFPTLENTITDLVVHSLTLTILVIFFMAIVRAPTKS